MNYLVLIILSFLVFCNSIYSQQYKNIVPNIIQISSLKGEIDKSKINKAFELLLSWERKYRRGFVPKFYLVYSPKIEMDNNKIKKEMLGAGFCLGYRFSIRDLIEPYIHAGFEYTNVTNEHFTEGVKFWRYGILIEYRLSYYAFLGFGFDYRKEITDNEFKSTIKALGIRLKFFTEEFNDR